MISLNVALSIFNGFVVKVGTEASAIELTLKHVNDSALASTSYDVRNICDIDIGFVLQSIFS